MSNTKEITMLSKLFSHVGEKQPVKARPDASAEGEKAQAPGEEAVKVSVDSGVSSDEAAERAKRVQTLAAQVEKGEYKPDLRKVAESVVRDLFV